MGKADWAKMETEYITSRISQRELADKYGVTLSAVSKVARKEGWFQKRKDHIQKVVAKAARNTAVRQAKQLTTLMKAADTLGAAIEKSLQDADQLYLHMVMESNADGSTAIEERVYRKMDTSALRNFTAAIKELTALARDFYNIPTPAQAEAQRIASERLELDRRKAAQTEQTDSTVQVLISGELEEYAK